MGKDLNGKELGTGIRQRTDGRYEARAKVKGQDINLYDTSLTRLKRSFQQAKELADSNLDQSRKDTTLNEWFEEWFNIYKLPNIKEQSEFPMKSKYYNTYGRLIGNMKVKDITNKDIQSVINTLKEEGRAVSSMRDALGRVRECLESAKNNRLVEVNPCFDILVPWENKEVQRRFLSEKEQSIFLMEADDNWYKEMFYTMFLTGMRIGEIGALKWSNVDFKNKCIHITNSLSCQYEKGVKRMRITTPKTQNSYRDIPFIGQIEEMLLSQKSKCEKLRKQLGNRWRSVGEEYEDLVFVTTMGSPILRYHAEKEIKKLVNSINLKEAMMATREGREPEYFETLYPHAIRHTFCSRCFLKGMNPKVVQKLMGHQHFSTTMDIYTHVTQDTVDDEVQKFGDIRLEMSV